MNAKSYLTYCQNWINFELERIFDFLEPADIKLYKAMKYTVLSGGKRIRGALVHATCKALGGEEHDSLLPACGIELIHAYSLVHDDLPCMDNDDLRRGIPSCHITFDEATAVLVGDALQSLAFDILSNPVFMGNLPIDVRLNQINIIARQIGLYGMAAGQSMDISGEGKEISPEKLKKMHTKKTGSLIEASIMMGALSAGSKDKTLETTLTELAKLIGLAFQVQDDILDVTLSTEKLGKPSCADLTKDKNTYVSMFGLSKAKSVLNQIRDEIHGTLDRIGWHINDLRSLLTYIMNRVH